MWKRLRDSHREALRRRRMQGTQIARPWKYEHLMEFIAPAGTSRDEDAPSAQHSDAVEEPEILIVCPAADDEDKATAEFRHKGNTLKLFEERAKRRRREVERVIVRKKDGKRARALPSDALTELFSSMCKKTRQLPIHLQLRVQREVFDSVARAEEEALSYAEDMDESKGSYRFKRSPHSDRDSESFAASRDDDASDNIDSQLFGC